MNIYLSIICLSMTLSFAFAGRAMPFTSSDGFYVTQWGDILVFVVLRMNVCHAFTENLLIVVMYDKRID